MSLRKKRILVTGAAGFLGKSLVTRLVTEGAFVIAIDRREILSMTDKRFKMDIAKPTTSLREVVGESDVIFHLAANSSAHMFKEFEPGFSANVQSLLRMLEYAAETGDKKRVVFPSSSTVYAGTPPPWTEDSVAEAPVNWYAASKVTGELLCKHYSHYRDLETVVLRIFCGYGPGELDKGVYASPPTLFIKNMIEGKRPEIWGDGKQERDLVYIDDVVEALILAARSRLEGDTFNVGTGIPTSFLELASLINEILDQNLVPRFVPSRMPQYLRKTLAHTAKAEKLLGFTPHTSLREGLVKTISSFKELRATAQIPTVSQ